MKIPFTKMHGCGNDYIYVNAMQHTIAEPSTAAIKWSNRYKGIGADGLVLIDRSPVPEADFSMRIFNADGSEAMMCGNASRCIGKYLYEKDIAHKTEIRLLTLSGIKTLLLHIIDCKVDKVTVDMGRPIMEDESQFVGDGGMNKGIFVSMGNPHAVVFVDDVDALNLEKIGPPFENHLLFPNRINTEFIQIVDRSHVKMRVWERGSGETMACGTGACASTVACVLNDLTDRHLYLDLLGGRLDITWDEESGHVFMTGPAVTSFEGEW